MVPKLRTDTASIWKGRTLNFVGRGGGVGGRGWSEKLKLFLSFSPSPRNQMAGPYVKEPYISSVHEVNAGRLHREFALHFQILDCWDQIVYILLTLEGISLKMLYEGIRGGGRGQSDLSPLLLTPFIRLTRYLAHIMSVLCTFN